MGTDNDRRIVRVSVNAEQFAAETRLAAYALINSFLVQHGLIAEVLAMRPAKLLVFLTIVTAAVQRLVRQPGLPEEFHGTARMPRAVIGYISRRAIAAATVLPRENVRRIVNELLAEDRLIVGPRGGLANRGGLLESAAIVESLRQQLVETARTCQSLLDAGVLEITGVEPPPGA